MKICGFWPYGMGEIDLGWILDFYYLNFFVGFMLNFFEGLGSDFFDGKLEFYFVVKSNTLKLISLILTFEGGRSRGIRSPRSQFLKFRFF